MPGGLFCDKIRFFYPSPLNRSPLILKDISHCFKRGRSTLVTGPTGSGKSTLLYLLAGLKRPSQGRILADGEPISRYNSRHLDLWRRKVGLVFQEPYLFADLTTLENTAAPLIPLNVCRLKVGQTATALFKELDLSHLADRRVKRLSGGERQRVSLARALITCPDYVLADEPTAFQDDLHTSAIAEKLQSAKNGGACVIVCSHDERLVNTGRFTEILRLNQGCLEALGACNTPY